MISNHPRPPFKTTLYKLNHNFVMKNEDGNRKKIKKYKKKHKGQNRKRIVYCMNTNIRG